MKIIKLSLTLVIVISVFSEARNLQVSQRVQTVTYDDTVIAFLELSNTDVYNPKVRPFTLVDIDIGISYRQLVSIDEKLGIMTSTFYLTLQWIDYRLQWDSTDPSLGNLTEIVLPATMVQSIYKFYFI